MNTLIYNDGRLKFLKEPKTFNDAWEFMKDYTDNATLEVVPVRYNGDVLFAIIDEDGLSKKLNYNPLASALRATHLIAINGGGTSAALVGDVLVLNEEISKEYLS